MQFLWKYADDLMGKGLDGIIVSELMFYATANLVPMALPLAILLSSIMAVGSLGENNELTAMKAGGMSLWRIMFPAAVLILFISIGAFYFSNYTWPAANLKLRVLISDITRKKPTIAIKEGVFYNEIEGMSLKVQRKIDHERFEDVLIIDQNEDGSMNRREITAKRARIRPSANNEMLLVDLWEGVIDEELDRKTIRDSKHPYQQTRFKHIELNIKLQHFNLERSDLNMYQETYEMLSVTQLLKTIDTLENERTDIHRSLDRNLKQTWYIYRDSSRVIPDSNLAHEVIIADTNRARIYQMAISSVRRKKEMIMSKTDILKLDMLTDMIRQHWVAVHRKFTLSYACILLFFIGAPLGAIIRKGGFGLPVVFSIVLFITYYMVSVTGEKMAKTGVIDVLSGMWLSAFILSPFAIFLLVQSMNDSRLLDMDTYKRIFFFAARKRKRQRTVSTR